MRLSFWLFVALFSFVVVGDDNSDYYTPQAVVIAVCLFVIGLLFTFIGYRLFAITIILLGFVLCGLFSYLFLTEVTEVDWYWIAGFSIIIGLVGAILFHCARYLAMFALGFGAGLIIALMASGIVDSFVDPATAGETWFKAAMWGGAILLGFICGCIVLGIQRILFILLTSILGAYLCVASVDYLLGDGTFSSVIHNAVDGTQSELNSWVPLVMFIAWALLSLFGIVIQFKVTSANYSHKARKTSSNQNQQKSSANASGNGVNYQINVNH